MVSHFNYHERVIKHSEGSNSIMRGEDFTASLEYLEKNYKGKTLLCSGFNDEIDEAEKHLKGLGIVYKKYAANHYKEYGDYSYSGLEVFPKDLTPIVRDTMQVISIDTKDLDFFLLTSEESIGGDITISFIG